MILFESGSYSLFGIRPVREPDATQLSEISTSPDFRCSLYRFFCISLPLEQIVSTPGPASSIGRAFAYYASNPSSNTDRTSFAPVADYCATLIFHFLFDKRNWTCRAANFNPLVWAKGTCSPNKLVL